MPITANEHVLDLCVIKHETDDLIVIHSHDLANEFKQAMYAYSNGQMEIIFEEELEQHTAIVPLVLGNDSCFMTHAMVRPTHLDVNCVSIGMHANQTNVTRLDSIQTDGVRKAISADNVVAILDAADTIRIVEYEHAQRHGRKFVANELFQNVTSFTMTRFNDLVLIAVCMTNEVDDNYERQYGLIEIFR